MLPYSDVDIEDEDSLTDKFKKSKETKGNKSFSYKTKTYF